MYRPVRRNRRDDGRVTGPLVGLKGGSVIQVATGAADSGTCDKCGSAIGTVA